MSKLAFSILSAVLVIISMAKLNANVLKRASPGIDYDYGTGSTPGSLFGWLATPGSNESETFNFYSNGSIDNSIKYPNEEVLADNEEAVLKSTRNSQDELGIKGMLNRFKIRENSSHMNEIDMDGFDKLDLLVELLSYLPNKKICLYSSEQSVSNQTNNNTKSELN